MEGEGGGFVDTMMNEFDECVRLGLVQGCLQSHFREFEVTTRAEWFPRFAGGSFPCDTATLLVLVEGFDSCREAAMRMVLSFDVAHSVFMGGCLSRRHYSHYTINLRLGIVGCIHSPKLASS